MLSQTAPFLQMFGAASGSFRKLENDINRASVINGVTEDDGEHLSDITGHVELQNVTFAYPSRSEHQVLKNVSLDCQAGKFTAIVGLSGSGKSTIAGLAARLYDPLEGRICLDDHDLRQLNARQFRSFMSVVQQEASLLNRSVLENIAHGLINSPDHTHLQPVLLSKDLADVAEAIRAGEDMMEAAKGKG